MPETRQAQRKKMGRDPQVLRQVWFHGAHSDIGGSYALHGLSDITLGKHFLMFKDFESSPSPGFR